MLDTNIVLGALIAGVIGILTVFISEYYKESRAKQFLSIALYGEVTENQRMIKAFLDFAPKLGKMEFDASQVSQIKNVTLDFARRWQFQKTVYTSASDKLGLLDNEIVKVVVAYYNRLQTAENMVFMLFQILGSRGKINKETFNEILKEIKEVSDIGRYLSEKLGDHAV